MRAARYHGVRDLRIEDVARPDVGPDDVLVRVAYAGICGSDLHVYTKGMFGIVPPMTMGHEFSGVVEAVGDSVDGLRPGDHVVGDPRLGCERCEWCHRGEYHLCAELAFVGEAIPGSYAEYIVLPERRLVPVPASLDLQLAALVRAHGGRGPCGECRRPARATVRRDHRSGSHRPAHAHRGSGDVGMACARRREGGEPSRARERPGEPMRCSRMPTRPAIAGPTWCSRPRADRRP